MKNDKKILVKGYKRVLKCMENSDWTSMVQTWWFSYLFKNASWYIGIPIIPCTSSDNIQFFFLHNWSSRSLSLYNRTVSWYFEKISVHIPEQRNLNIVESGFSVCAFLGVPTIFNQEIYVECLIEQWHTRSLWLYLEGKDNWLWKALENIETKEENADNQQCPLLPQYFLLYQRRKKVMF